MTPVSDIERLARILASSTGLPVDAPFSGIFRLQRTVKGTYSKTSEPLWVHYTEEAEAIIQELKIRPLTIERV